MMVAEKATAPESAAPCSEQNNPRQESTTECAYCPEGVNVYQMGDDQWICTDHIGAVVSLAANDVFSGDVFYTAAFERVLM